VLDGCLQLGRVREIVFAEEVGEQSHWFQSQVNRLDSNCTFVALYMAGESSRG
jgi:hypothetical protein